MTGSVGWRGKFRKGPGALMIALALLLVLSAPGAGCAEDLRLGMSAPFSGPDRALGLEYLRGAMAWLGPFNAAGGERGVTVRILAHDDGYDPERCLENTVRLLRDDNVFALFAYVGTPTTTRILPLLLKFGETNPRLLFPLSGAEPLREPPYGRFVFNLRTSYAQETAALVDHFVNDGRRRIAVFYQADAYGRSGWDGVRRRLHWHGLEMASEAAYHRGASFVEDFSEQADLLAKGRPQAVIVAGTAPACAALVRDLRGMGVECPVAALSFADADSILQLLRSHERATGADLTRGFVFSQVVPCYEDRSLPGVRRYREMMDAYDGLLPEGVTLGGYNPHKYSSISFEGFLDARLLTAMLRRMPGRPDRADIDGVLDGMGEVDLGLGEPVRFGPQRRQGLDRVYLAEILDGRVVPLESGGER